MARITVLQEIRKALEPGFRGSVAIHSQVRMYYDSGYDSILHFLSNVYGSMTSPVRKKKFREALGILFAEHMRKSDGSAALVLDLVAGTGAYDQLANVIQVFNDAKIASDEVNGLLYDFLATLKGAEPTELTYGALRQLVDGPKFEAGYAIEALQLELECHPNDCRTALYRYAPMIHSLCRKVERTKKRSEKKSLRLALEDLQSLVDRLHLDTSVGVVFDEFGVQHGKWPELMGRITSNEAKALQ